MILSIAQLVQLAANAGFTGDDLATAVAIAMAESGGNPDAYNAETAANTPQGQGSYGLWQIYLKAHPEFAGENLYDPQTNADAAFSIYSNAGGFSPWATYTGGEYLAELGAADAQISPSDSLSTSSDGTQVLEASFIPDDSTMLYLLAGGALAFFLVSRLFG